MKTEPCFCLTKCSYAHSYTEWTNGALNVKFPLLKRIRFTQVQIPLNLYSQMNSIKSHKNSYCYYGGADVNIHSPPLSNRTLAS